MLYFLIRRSLDLFLKDCFLLTFALPVIFNVENSFFDQSVVEDGVGDGGSCERRHLETPTLASHTFPMASSSVSGALRNSHRQQGRRAAGGAASGGSAAGSGGPEPGDVLRAPGGSPGWSPRPTPRASPPGLHRIRQVRGTGCPSVSFHSAWEAGAGVVRPFKTRPEAMCLHPPRLEPGGPAPRAPRQGGGG